MQAEASLARVDVATARLRAESHPDAVLEQLAKDARVLGGCEHAWAARLEGHAPISVRRSAREGAELASNAPPFAELHARLEGRELARVEGFVVASLLGSSGRVEGLLVLVRPSAASVPELEAALRILATVAGLVLESARLRASADGSQRTREQLLASISHDLRNPLNTFAMSAGLLRDDLERNDIDRTRGLSLVSRMERSTSRMEGLIEDVVEASRIDARKIEVVLRQEQASQLVTDAIETAKRSGTERTPRATFESIDDDVRVMADRNHTVQALAKVIAFETKATGEGGTVRLALSRRDGAVLFTASAMQSGGAPVPRPPEGRDGLLLLLAAGLVEAQGGTFQVEPAEGLVIAFTLRIARP